MSSFLYSKKLINLLKADVQKIRYEFDSKKILFLIGLCVRILSLFLLGAISILVSKLNNQDFSNIYFLSAILFDLLLKFAFLQIRSINLSFFYLHVSKINCLAYIMVKSVINHYNLILPLLIIGFLDFYLVIIFTLVSLINSQLVIITKYFSKFIIPVYIGVMYFLTQFLNGFVIITNIKLTLTYFSVFLLFTMLTFIILNNNFNIVLEGKRARPYFNFGVRTRFFSNSLIAHEFQLFLRNKRPRTYLISGSIVSLIALIDGEITSDYFIFFLVIVMSGGSIFSIWQITPFWDSSNFSFFLTNTFFKNYLRNKFLFIYIISFINFALIFCAIYIVDKGLILVLLAAYLFNIGINSKIVFIISSRSNASIELNSNPFFNYQGVQSFSLISSIVAIYVSVLLLGTLNIFFSEQIGLLVISFIGIIGLISNGYFIELCVNRFSFIKYKN